MCLSHLNGTAQLSLSVQELWDGRSWGSLCSPLLSTPFSAVGTAPLGTGLVLDNHK